MSLRTFVALVRREAAMGPRNAILIFALVLPVVLSLLLNLLFGNGAVDRPRLALTSADAALFAEGPFSGIALSTYEDADAVRRAVERGSADLGLLPAAGFAESVRRGDSGRLTVLIWGQSLQRNRVLISTALTAWVRDLSGGSSFVTVTTEQVGAEQGWRERLLPMLILVSIAFGATMYPASSLVLEKMRRTLQALHITPVSTAEIFLAKGLLGVAVACGMTLLVLAMNNLLHSAIAPLGLVLVLGSVFAAQIGVLIGALVRDIEALFALIKSIAILLYGPALLALFPQVPAWIAWLFPTYYVVQPVLELTELGAGLADVAPQLAVLLLQIVVMFPILTVVGRRMRERL